MKAVTKAPTGTTPLLQSPSVSALRQGGRAGGFTLIELAITVAIIAILAVIAYPSYRQYALRAHRAEAKNLLLQAASRQERFYATSSPNSYATKMTKLGYSSDSQPTDPPPAPNHYNVSVSNVQPAGCSPNATPCTGFTLTATPQNGQTDDPCKALTLNSLGEKKAPNAINGHNETECWHK